MSTASSPRLQAVVLGCLLLSLPASATTFTVTVVERSSGEPVENAVVTLPGTEPPEAVDNAVVQSNRTFQPGVLVTPVGSHVNFPNHDDTLHHVYSFSEAKTFDIELYAGVPESPVHFDEAGIVELGCNIHDQMQGFVIVTDHAHTARTDSKGVATFNGIQTDTEADLEVRLWHPRQLEVERFETGTVTPEASSSAAQVQLELRPEPEASDDFDELQQQFQDL